MYGPLEMPFHMELPTGDVVIKKVRGCLLYNRTTPKKTIEKRIMIKKGTIYLSPVEPINTPKFLTPNLMIELKRTLFIPPKENKKVYLRFPVEIGVIVRNGKNEKLVDVFAKNPPKYTLYGDVRTGTICRYYLSNLSLKVPKTDIGSEGVIEVSIRNQTNEWREISKLVFLGTLMKIYYSEDLVSMKALVKVTDDDMAETKFIDQPIRDGQKRAFETLPTKNKKMIPQRYVMEGGY
ncbi:MAG: DUF432 domain-containing protein [Thermoplasmatota archaeon]